MLNIQDMFVYVGLMRKWEWSLAQPLVIGVLRMGQANYVENVSLIQSKKINSLCSDISRVIGTFLVIYPRRQKAIGAGYGTSITECEHHYKKFDNLHFPVLKNADDINIYKMD